MSREGFGGLLADSNLFQRILIWGNAWTDSRSATFIRFDCDLSSVTSSLAGDIKLLFCETPGQCLVDSLHEELKECYGKN